MLNALKMWFMVLRPQARLHPEIQLVLEEALADQRRFKGKGGSPYADLLAAPRASRSLRYSIKTSRLSQFARRVLQHKLGELRFEVFNKKAILPFASVLARNSPVRTYGEHERELKRGIRLDIVEHSRLINLIKAALRPSIRPSALRTPRR